MNIKSATISFTLADGSVESVTTDSVKHYSIDVQELQETDSAMETRTRFLPNSETRVRQKYPGPLRYLSLVFEVKGKS